MSGSGRADGQLKGKAADSYDSNFYNYLGLITDFRVLNPAYRLYLRMPDGYRIFLNQTKIIANT